MPLMGTPRSRKGKFPSTRTGRDRSRHPLRIPPSSREGPFPFQGLTTPMGSMGQVHSAQPMDKVRALVTLAVAVSVATTCSGDDDEAEPTVPSTTAAATTEPPTTTAPPTTTEPPTTTAAPTTPAAHHDARCRSPEGPDRCRLRAGAPTPGGPRQQPDAGRPGRATRADGRRIGHLQQRQEFVEGMVANGERVVNGDPDYSTVTVETVELVGRRRTQKRSSQPAS